MELDLGALMRKAQELSRDLEGRKEELGRREVEGQSGAGLVVAVMSGRGQLLRLRIDPQVYGQGGAGQGEAHFLEDLIVAAVNAALVGVEKLQQSELQSLAAGPFGGAFPAGFPPGFPGPSGDQ